MTQKKQGAYSELDRDIGLYSFDDVFRGCGTSLCSAPARSLGLCEAAVSFIFGMPPLRVLCPRPLSCRHCHGRQARAMHCST